MWVLLILLILVFVIIKLLGKSESTGHWSHLFADMQHDPEDFYNLVEETLERWQIPNYKTHRRTFSEGKYGLLSHNRLYLEVSRGDYIYHICAAPWGSAFFFSWWLRKKSGSSMFEKLPVIGSFIAESNKYDTYYKLDTDGMFRGSVEEAVQSAIGQLTKAKGIRELTELERKPDLRSMFK